LKIHLIGVGGIAMSGVAGLLKEIGHIVQGSEKNTPYPPASEVLKKIGLIARPCSIDNIKDFAPEAVIVGNSVKADHSEVRYAKEKGIPLFSFPGFLEKHVLPGKKVLVCAGTHGKTTTTSMVAWILEYAGLDPGFLIGGVPSNFSISARLGESPFFVVEADEYDTSYFDRRSKFVHYRPKTLVINNLEYDHADIFNDLDSIQTQFHHLVRTVPSDGLIVAPRQSSAVDEVLRQGCWTPVSRFAAMEEKGLQYPE